MTTGPDDPYRTPAPVRPAEQQVGIHYWHGYTWWLENPDWLSNLGYVSLCMLVPYVGPIAVLGYQFEVISGLIRDPEQRYPNFEFHRFVDYLKRGLWPFLVMLIIMTVVLPAMMIVIYGSVILVALAAQQRNEPKLLLLLLGVVLLTLPITALLNAARFPPFLRAGLQGNLQKVFELSFYRDFFARVLWPALAIELFLTLTALPLLLMGMSCFFVGIFVAVGVLSMAQANHWYQLYWLYLARGGQPIELTADAPPVRPPDDARPHVQAEVVDEA